MAEKLTILFFFITPVTYFYFNWRYFAWITVSLGMGHIKKSVVAGIFLLNYTIFFICSRLEWDLMVNWAVFFVFLSLETVLYSRTSRKNAFYFSLSGILCGLTINIFCRCAVSIAIDQPLANFDNHVYSAANLKGIPVLLGFLLGGIVLHAMAGASYQKNLRTLLAHPQHLFFLLEVMSGMFLYLFLNLLLYQSMGNGVLLKLWGIKSCVFALMGTYLGTRYSLQMCELSDYREKNRAIRQKLARRAKEEAGLRSAAYRDVLTGAYSRQYAVEAMDHLLERGEGFVLCFVDLDHLKEVNDRFGHSEGDRYLVLAAQRMERTCRKGRDLLCRYGGDEFLLVFQSASVAAAEERIQAVDRALQEMGCTGQTPFSMSLSWGVVDSGAGEDAEALIRVADTRMYEKKKAGHPRG